jgi:hypothetical protein
MPGQDQHQGEVGAEPAAGAGVVGVGNAPGIDKRLLGQNLAGTEVPAPLIKALLGQQEMIDGLPFVPVIIGTLL